MQRIKELEEKQQLPNQSKVQLNDRKKAIEQKKDEKCYWEQYPKAADKLPSLIPPYILKNSEKTEAKEMLETWLKQASVAVKILIQFEENGYIFNEQPRSDGYIVGILAKTGYSLYVKICPQGLLLHAKRLYYSEVLDRIDFPSIETETLQESVNRLFYNLGKREIILTEQMENQTAKWELARSNDSMKEFLICQKCGAKTTQITEPIDCCNEQMQNKKIMPAYILSIKIEDENNTPKIPYNKKEENGWHYDILRCMSADEKEGKYTFIVENYQFSLVEHLVMIQCALIGMNVELVPLNLHIVKLDFNLDQFSESDKKLIKLVLKLESLIELSQKFFWKQIHRME